MWESEFLNISPLLAQPSVRGSDSGSSLFDFLSSVGPSSLAQLTIGGEDERLLILIRLLYI